MKTTSPRSGSGVIDHAIHPPARGPQPFPGQPTPVAAERADLAVQRVGCGVSADGLDVGEERDARPVGVRWHRIGGGSPVELGVGPTGGHLEPSDSAQGEFEGLETGHRSVGYDLIDCMVVHHH